MEEISANDDDDHEEEEEEEGEEDDWDIGLSSTCSKKIPSQGLISFEAEINTNAEETEKDDDYYDDDDDHDDYDDGDDDDNDDQGKCELGCPYCTENLDILGLCCHIDDQHYKEAKSGICPICSKKLETSMTVHIIAEHESFLRTLRKKKFRGSGTHTDLFLLKKEGYPRPQLVVLSRADPSHDLSPDHFLLSFVQNSKPAYRIEDVQALSPTEAGLSGENSNDNIVDRNIELPPLTDKLQDKAQVCEFVNGLLFSTIFDDGS